MNNFFIEQYFDWKVRRTSFLDRVVTKALASLGSTMEFRSAEFIDQAIMRVIGRDYRFSSSGRSTNIDQRINMWHLVRQVLAYDVEGDLVELGCNEGTSSILISKLLAETGSSKKLMLFDSFEGLPSTKTIDGLAYTRGDLATTEDVVRHNFQKYKLPLPEIHKGWFNQTLTALPDKICFAYLDGDLYDSIMVSLEHVYPRMTKGSICLIDDYCDPRINPMGWNKLPGVKQACDEYLSDKPEKIEFLYSGFYSHGYFRKL
jgi:O-methyltransferase